MENFPINLEAVYFTKNIVVSMPGHQPKLSGQIKNLPVNNLRLEELDASKKSFIATFTMKMNPQQDPDDPYYLDMECIGTFTIREDADYEEAKKGLLLLAHNVLYGSIRESVLWFTGRHPYGPINLGLTLLRSDSEVLDTL